MLERGDMGRCVCVVWGEGGVLVLRNRNISTVVLLVSMFASISSLGAVCCFMITILCYYNVKCFPSQAGLSSCARTVSSIAVLPWTIRFISASFHKTIGRTHTHPHTVDISSALTIAFIAFISIDCGPCLLNVKFANNNKETTWLEVCVNNYVQQIVQRGRYKYRRMKNISAVPGWEGSASAKSLPLSSEIIMGKTKNAHQWRAKKQKTIIWLPNLIQLPQIP